MRLSRFARFAWFVLIYNVVVILWGAFVRATGSGAGCGAHWPTCQGEVVPIAPQIETIIEFVHRMTSGVALLLVLGLALWAFRAFPRRHPVRLGATLSVIFIITEALIGAGLVLFGLTAENASAARAGSLGLHLVNTFLLLAALALTGWWASGGRAVRLRAQGATPWAVGLAMIATMLVGATGAITALGDTLFPAGSLAEGISQDLSPTAHFLVQLRVIHPALAVVTGVALIILAMHLRRRQAAADTTRLSGALIAAVVVQLAAGMINLALLAPIALQLIHLMLADAVWLTLVLASASSLGVPASVAEADQAASAALPARAV